MINITKLFKIWDDTACTCELHDMITFQTTDKPYHIKLAPYFKVPNSHTERDNNAGLRISPEERAVK